MMERVQNTVPGLRRDGAGFVFFREYFELVKQAQALCEDVSVSESGLLDAAQKFSELYQRYEDKPQTETGVDRQYLRSLCVAGCDLIDRHLKVMQQGYACEEVER